MQVEKYVRKPFEIDAVRVTEENLSEVAKWCQGDIRSETRGSYIHVRVHNAVTVRQTKAFVGDWVLYSGKGYKVYTDKALHRNFEPKLEELRVTDQVVES